MSISASLSASDEQIIQVKETSTRSQLFSNENDLKKNPNEKLKIFNIKKTECLIPFQVIKPGRRCVYTKFDDDVLYVLQNEKLEWEKDYINLKKLLLLLRRELNFETDDFRIIVKGVAISSTEIEKLSEQVVPLISREFIFGEAFFNFIPTIKGK